MAEHWFQSTPAIDQTIRDRFESLWESAAGGELTSWQDSPEGCLALCIVLDQFPLNMFRGESKSFSTEQQAVMVTKEAVAKGLDQQLTPAKRAFFVYAVDAQRGFGGSRRIGPFVRGIRFNR